MYNYFYKSLSQINSKDYNKFKENVYKLKKWRYNEK